MKLVWFSFLSLVITINCFANSSGYCGHGDGCYNPPLHVDPINNDTFDTNLKTDEDYFIPVPQQEAFELSELNNLEQFPKRIVHLGERIFVFSPRLLRWAAYDEEGYMVSTGKANGGAPYCEELNAPCRTPEGSYRVERMGDEDCFSHKFPLGEGGAPMPYCMFFGHGLAIHGSPYISNGNTSHGCIRVYLKAAKWLQLSFIRVGTKVVVLSY